MADRKQLIAKLSSDGEIISCAKGMATNDCGYTPGAKVCGKCGALAVQAKEDEDIDMENDDMTIDETTFADDEKAAMAMQRRRPMVASSMMSDDEDEELDDSEMPSDEEMEAIEEDDEDVEESDIEKMESAMAAGADPQYMAVAGKKKPGKKMATDGFMCKASETMVNAPCAECKGGCAPTGYKMMDDVEEEDEDVMSMRKKMRSRRLATLGYKSDDFDDEPFICGMDRKVYPAGHQVCESCPGGCVAENGMPSLLEVEGMVEDAISGKVLDSGYSEAADSFVLDVERKDGTPVEVFVDGSSGEILGWHKLEMSDIEFKTANQSRVVIGFHDAADIAVKSVQGEVMKVEPDIFDGFDAYAVEIDGIDGKSYDVFVSLEGNVLGYDEYTSEEAQEIEAEAAEIALKRAYSDETRAEMAKEGSALPDGSYPIKDESDLKNAIQAFGRAKDKSAAKAHITKRAKALGLSELIPVNWSGSEKSESDGAVVAGSEEGKFLSSLMEFELLSEEIDATKPQDF